MAHRTEHRAGIARVTVLALLVTVVLAACSSDSGEPGTGTDLTTTTTATTTTNASTTTEATTTTTDATTTTSSDRDFSIGIVNFAFDVNPLVISVGETVTWKNITEDTSHTTTSTDELWTSGVLGPGETFETTFDTAGTFTYFCGIHQSMSGTIEVRG